MSILYWIFILLSSLYFSNSFENGLITNCSRLISRKVRNFIQRDVFNTLRINSDSLPNDCPLNPKLDIYYEQEHKKYQVHNDEWKCQICNKRFVSEFYLDRHMDRKHSDHLKNTTSQSVCLADYCPMFGCNSKSSLLKNVEDYSERDFNPFDSTSKRFVTLEKCVEAEVKRYQLQCIEISKRCFSNNRAHRDLESNFNEKVCKNIKCLNGILQGGIKINDHDPQIIYWVFRIMFIVLLTSVAVLQCAFTDSPWTTWLYFRIRQAFQGNNLDNRFIEKINQSKKKPPNFSISSFFNTIFDAFNKFFKRNKQI